MEQSKYRLRIESRQVNGEKDDDQLAEHVRLLEQDARKEGDVRVKTIRRDRWRGYVIITIPRVRHPSA